MTAKQYQKNLLDMLMGDVKKKQRKAKIATLLGEKPEPVVNASVVNAWDMEDTSLRETLRVVWNRNHAKKGK